MATIGSSSNNTRGRASLFDPHHHHHQQQQQQEKEELAALAWIFAPADSAAPSPADSETAPQTSDSTPTSPQDPQRKPPALQASGSVEDLELLQRSIKAENQLSGEICATHSSLHGSSNDSSNTNTSSSRYPMSFEATRKPKFSHTGARQQYEIRQLKAQAERLELLLQQLMSPTPKAMASSASDKEQDAALVVWRDAARKQLELLVRSQRDNQQLRARVQNQKKMARSLRRMLLHRVADSAVLSEKLFRPRNNLQLMCDDHFMFTKMVADLTDMRANLDVKLRAIEHHSRARGSFRDWRVGLDAQKSIVLEMFAGDEVPFQKSEVDDADFGGSSEMFASTELMKITSPADVGIYRQRQAGWWHADEKRSVLALVAFLDCVDELSNPVPGFVFKLQMWKIRTAHVHVNARTGEEEHSTSLKIFVTISPALVHGPYALDWDREEIERTLIPVFDRRIASRIQATENILIDRRVSQA